jgi:outer membrane protein
MKKLIKVAVVVAGVFAGMQSAKAQQKFAHINSGDLLVLMPEMKAADANYQTFQKQKQSKLELMNTEREKKITAYNDKNKTISEANKDVVGKELQTLATEIEDLGKRIQQEGQAAQEELKTKWSELYDPILGKAEAAVKAVAKEKGYAYVFDISQQSGLVYFDGGDDISALVKVKLGLPANATPPAASTAPAAKKP